MSWWENSLTWIGQNKLSSFLSILCFILFISTISMAAQKGNWETRATTCEAKLVTTTSAPTTESSVTPSPSTESSVTPSPSTESSVTAAPTTEETVTP